ncbi:WG repeat-containing protein [uncultured Microscilla sp.]|uniref:WG repeat-containing protein n=1 Tax=uncultured Microscilla sp. TaxID=432653 RepID=UPI0026307CB7|nr:WG repeat-containing protein [uncultured Microscilla sp.]
MMKQLMAFLVCLSLSANAQTPRLIPYLQNQRWGFVNQERTIVIPCIYHYVAPFSEGLALVELNRKYGYIDRSGKTVIALKYDKAQSFSNGRAKVEVIFGKKTDGQFKAGYIDKTGQAIIPVAHLGVTTFRDSVAMVWNGHQHGYINWRGDTLLKHQYVYATPFSEGRALVANQPPRYDPALGIHIFSKAAFIDTQGKVQATIRRAGAESYANGLALIIAKNNDSTQVMYFIDKQGNKVLDVSEYGAVHGFTEGLAAVMNQGKVGFINPKGTLVVACQYVINAEWFRQEHKRRMPRFVGGLAAVALPNKGWNLIDPQGQVQLPTYYQYLQIVPNQQVLAKKNGRWGIIQPSGKIILPLQYDAVKPFKNGLALVRKGKRRFYVDRVGEEYFDE